MKDGACAPYPDLTGGHARPYIEKPGRSPAPTLKSIIDDKKSGFLLEIIDGRELPEYMTMNKGKICG